MEFEAFKMELVFDKFSISAGAQSVGVQQVRVTGEREE